MTPQCNTNTYHYTKEPLLIKQTRTATLLTTNKINITKFKREQKEKKDSNTIKCVLVGDKAVGKTSLAVSYSTGLCPKEYTPTAYDNYNVVVQVDGNPIRLELCDTAGEEYIPLRSLCYPGTDVFLLCFSVVNPASFRSASSRWAEELSRQNAAVVLVGTQSDLREDLITLRRLKEMGETPIQTSEANKLAERLGGEYIETSAGKSFVIKQAFDLAIIAGLERHRQKSKKWWRRLCCV